MLQNAAMRGGPLTPFEGGLVRTRARGPQAASGRKLPRSFWVDVDLFWTPHTKKEQRIRGQTPTPVSMGFVMVRIQVTQQVYQVIFHVALKLFATADKWRHSRSRSQAPAAGSWRHRPRHNQRPESTYGSDHVSGNMPPACVAAA